MTFCRAHSSISLWHAFSVVWTAVVSPSNVPCIHTTFVAVSVVTLISEELLPGSSHDVAFGYLTATTSLCCTRPTQQQYIVLTWLMKLL